MTTGALSSPEATISLNRSARLVALAVARASRCARAAPGTRPAPGAALIHLCSRCVVREQVEHGPVGGVDVLRVARQRGPPERPLALREQRPDVGGHEAGERERPREAAAARLVADGVAVVEDLGAGVLEPDHRLDVPGHRGPRPVGELLRLLAPRSRASRRGRRPRAGRTAGRGADVWSVTMSTGTPRAQQFGQHDGGSCRPGRPTARAARPWRARTGRSRRRGRRRPRRGSGARPGGAGARGRRRRPGRRRRSASPRAAARRPCRRSRR